MGKKPIIAITSSQPVGHRTQVSYVDCVAAEKSAWGDSWTKNSEPLPVCCLAWKGDMIDLLRPVMLGPAWHRRILAKANDSTEVERRAVNGDKVREMITGWYGDRWADRIGRRGLSILVSCKMLPIPNGQAVREWLDGAVATGHRRGAIDHEQRMAEADGVFDVPEVA
jgi:hypothetical protein